LSGVQILTGYGGNHGPPLRIREIDVTNGVMGACAILTALLHRQRTGLGQHVDMSQLEAMTSGLIGEHLLGFLATRVHMPPLGNRHVEYAPQGCYPCAGEDKYVTLSIQSEEDWVSLCELIRQPGAAVDPRFATPQLRRGAHDVIDRMIIEWTSALTHYDAMAALQERGIAAGAVLNSEEVANNLHLREREFIKSPCDGSAGNYPGPPFVLSGERPAIRRVGPRLGEDNEYVICGMMGKSKEEVFHPQEHEIGTAFDIE
jgi:crotonobetainyl-CoA:carnitine CoA-transferase CaiB-like acyl-CoA transferase